MEQKNRSQIKPHLASIALVIGIFVVIPIIIIFTFKPLGLVLADTIFSLIPPNATFKRTCEELNGKKFSWNEVKKLKGYCMYVPPSGGIETRLCTEDMNYINLSVHSTAEVEGTWSCEIEKADGTMKTSVVYKHL